MTCIALIAALAAALVGTHTCTAAAGQQEQPSLEQGYTAALQECRQACSAVRTTTARRVNLARQKYKPPAGINRTATELFNAELVGKSVAGNDALAESHPSDMLAFKPCVVLLQSLVDRGYAAAQNTLGELEFGFLHGFCQEDNTHISQSSKEGAWQVVHQRDVVGARGLGLWKQARGTGSWGQGALC